MPSLLQNLLDPAVAVAREQETPPMERSRHLLLVLTLVALLGTASATTAGAVTAACEPANLATQVTLFCVPDMPTAQCCEPVVAAVDLGGGVPCLCRVAAQPPLVMASLNATHLLALYTACGGLRPGGAHLAAACESPPPMDASPPPPAVVHKPAPAKRQTPNQKPSPAPRHGNAPDPSVPTIPLTPGHQPARPPAPSGSASQQFVPAATFFLTALIAIA